MTAIERMQATSLLTLLNVVKVMCVSIIAGDESLTKEDYQRFWDGFKDDPGSPMSFPFWEDVVKAARIAGIKCGAIAHVLTEEELDVLRKELEV